MIEEKLMMFLLYSVIFLFFMVFYLHARITMILTNLTLAKSAMDAAVGKLNIMVEPPQDQPPVRNPLAG